MMTRKILSSGSHSLLALGIANIYAVLPMAKTNAHLSTMRLRLTACAGVLRMASWMCNANPLTLASASAFFFSGVSILAACAASPCFEGHS